MTHRATITQFYEGQYFIIIKKSRDKFIHQTFRLYQVQRTFRVYRLPAQIIIAAHCAPAVKMSSENETIILLTKRLQRK